MLALQQSTFVIMTKEFNFNSDRMNSKIGSGCFNKMEYKYNDSIPALVIES